MTSHWQSEIDRRIALLRLDPTNAYLPRAVDAGLQRNDGAVVLHNGKEEEKVSGTFS